MTVDGNTLYFTYDASGTPQTVTYNGTTYYYATNLQGDITAILDNTGTTVVSYTYDAWGNHTSGNNGTGTLASTLGRHNPLRYRGYVYDTESELYYLQSRYYNPAIGRFINADDYMATGQGLLGNNMFAYCGNNPVNYADPSGHSWIAALIASIANIVCATVLSGCSSSTENVLVMSNNLPGWISSSETMGKDMAKAVGGSSHVEEVTDETFSEVWSGTESSHVIIHTHGSPNALGGEGLHFNTSDLQNLQRNPNIKFVLITSCTTGGYNNGSANVGQLISQKIAPDGIVVCPTTVVRGASTKFTATSGGNWVAYQNGVQIASNLPATITMGDVAKYWNNYLN